jgi:hypothetical protein
MSEPLPPSDESASARGGRNWNALSAIIAALIGLLALCVSGYTAYIQREQVRAQVWPDLIAGNDDNDLSLIVYSKGVGPAIVRNAQIWVDGKPQTDWTHALDALGMKHPITFSQSTINPAVVSAGENVRIIKFEDKAVYRQFRAAAVARHMAIAICYCSTLGECWNYRDAHLVGFKRGPLQVTSVGRCPRLPPSEVFNN